MAATALATTSTRRRRSTNAQMAARRVARYRLAVVGSTVVDVVAEIGGWLVDRVLAGWNVTVYLPDAEDSAALKILGLAAGPLSELRLAGNERPTAVAVAGDLLGAESAVRADLIAALSEMPEVTVWGTPIADDLSGDVHTVQHELSAAARAFKTHAANASCPGGIRVTATEVLQTTRARHLADGSVELLGRDSVTINSAGGTIFAEDVEAAIASHAAVADVVIGPAAG